MGAVGSGRRTQKPQYESAGRARSLRRLSVDRSALRSGVTSWEKKWARLQCRGWSRKVRA